MYLSMFQPPRILLGGSGGGEMATGPFLPLPSPFLRLRGPGAGLSGMERTWEKSTWVGFWRVGVAVVGVVGRESTLGYGSRFHRVIRILLGYRKAGTKGRAPVGQM